MTWPEGSTVNALELDAGPARGRVLQFRTYLIRFSAGSAGVVKHELALVLVDGETQSGTVRPTFGRGCLTAASRTSDGPSSLRRKELFASLRGTSRQRRTTF